MAGRHRETEKLAQAGRKFPVHIYSVGSWELSGFSLVSVSCPLKTNPVTYSGLRDFCACHCSLRTCWASSRRRLMAQFHSHKVALHVSSLAGNGRCKRNNLHSRRREPGIKEILDYPWSHPLPPCHLPPLAWRPPTGQVFRHPTEEWLNTRAPITREFGFGKEKSGVTSGAQLVS